MSYFLAEGPDDYFFLFLRWTRVRRSNLRCFFLAIRLRRFLITEPINNPNLAVVRASPNPTVAGNGGLTRSRTPQ